MKKPVIYLAILNFALLLIFTSELNAQNASGSSSPYLDSMITGIMETNHVPGLSACIIKDTQIPWIGTYGYANFEWDIQVDTATLFELASVSKTITVTALMQLWEDGYIDLDDDINDYLSFEVRNPGYPYQPITFRQICTHTSTIRDNWDLMTYYWGEDSPIPLDEYLFNYLNPEGDNYYPDLNYYSQSTPGSAWHYCNIAVMLMGYLVEVIAEIPFPEYTETNIFEPLEMFETSWFLAGLDTTHIAMPYHWNGSGYDPYGFFGYSDYPAGQLRTSVTQLANFLISYMEYGQFQGHQILSSATIDTIFTNHSPLTLNMGLIWFKTQPFGRLEWGHNGGDFGIATRMYFAPEENTGVILLSNGENHSALSQIENILFDYAEDSIIITNTENSPIDILTECLHIYPNPCSGATHLSYQIKDPPVGGHSTRYLISDLYSISGLKIKRLLNEMRMPGEYEMEVDLSELPPGVYVVILDIEGITTAKKLVVR